MNYRKLRKKEREKKKEKKNIFGILILKYC